MSRLILEALQELKEIDSEDTKFENNEQDQNIQIAKHVAENETLQNKVLAAVSKFTPTEIEEAWEEIKKYYGDVKLNSQQQQIIIDNLPAECKEKTKAQTWKTLNDFFNYIHLDYGKNPKMLGLVVKIALMVCFAGVSIGTPDFGILLVIAAVIGLIPSDLLGGILDITNPGGIILRAGKAISKNRMERNIAKASSKVEEDLNKEEKTRLKKAVKELSGDKEKVSEVADVLIDNVKEEDIDKIYSLIKKHAGNVKLNSEQTQKIIDKLPEDSKEKARAQRWKTLKDVFDFIDYTPELEANPDVIITILKIAFIIISVVCPADGFILDIISLIVALIPNEIVAKVVAWAERLLNPIETIAHFGSKLADKRIQKNVSKAQNEDLDENGLKINKKITKLESKNSNNLTKEEQKELGYLKRKERVSPLDKEERYRLMELSKKANNFINKKENK